MTFPIANIPLDIWSMAPTKYLYTNTIQNSPELSFSNPSAVSTLAGSFEITATGITRTVGAVVTPLADAYGRLPNATELDGSPYYTMIVVGNFLTADQNAKSLYIERTGADGSLVRDYAGPEFLGGASGGDNKGCFWAFKIPSTTTSVKVNAVLPSNGGTAAVFGMGLCYAIPSVPKNSADETFSATDALRYELAPLFPVASDTKQLPVFDPVNPTGNSVPLVLPTSTQLNGAPWYYVAFSFSGNLINGPRQANRFAFAVNMVDQASGISGATLAEASHIIPWGAFNTLQIGDDQGHFQYVPKAVGMSGTVGSAADAFGSGSGVQFPASDVLLKLSAADTNTLTMINLDDEIYSVGYTFYIPVLPETA